jgi:hypothetical protein
MAPPSAPAIDPDTVYPIVALRVRAAQDWARSYARLDTVSLPSEPGALVTDSTAYIAQCYCVDILYHDVSYIGHKLDPQP